MVQPPRYSPVHPGPWTGVNRGVPGAQWDWGIWKGMTNIVLTNVNKVDPFIYLLKHGEYSAVHVLASA